tara:strand:+ start:350 stop:505 length:156 start_codon:yes stop_codon:yes gene_type:complete
MLLLPKLVPKDDRDRDMVTDGDMIIDTDIDDVYNHCVSSQPFLNSDSDSNI